MANESGRVASRSVGVGLKDKVLETLGHPSASDSDADSDGNAGADHREGGGDSPRRVACLLLPGFSLLSAASAIDAMQACNRITGEERYRIEVLGESHSVSSDFGVDMATMPIHSLIEEAIDGLLVCGGGPADYPAMDEDVLSWLSKRRRHFSWLAGIGTGGYCLARAGLLDRRKASVHWWSLQELRDQFPEIFFSTELFSMDDEIATCRGGTAALDMMFSIIGRQQGSDMVDALSQHFVRERVGRSGAMNERRRLSADEMQEQPVLHDAIQLMEANIEEPLGSDDLAMHVGLSRRQMERLFRKYLNTVPSRYYLQIRLEAARRQLQSNGLPISDVALACGFASSAHFSTVYRNHFGVTPSEERSLKASAVSDD